MNPNRNEASYDENSIYKGYNDYAPLESDDNITTPGARQKSTVRRRKKQKSLIAEYICHWYVILLCLVLYPIANMTQIFLNSFFLAKNMPGFLSALLTMFLGGLIATFPFLILNIVLAKRKKYYAIVVQIVTMELIGIVLYLKYKTSSIF